MQFDPTSLFMRYSLTPEEEKAGFSYSGETRAVMQNLLSKAAEELMLIRLDSDLGTSLDVGRRAYLAVQIDILKYILGITPEDFSSEESPESED